MLTFWLTGTVVSYFAFLMLTFIGAKISGGGYIKSFRLRFPEEKDTSDVFILSITHIVLVLASFMGWPLMWLALFFKIADNKSQKQNG